MINRNETKTRFDYYPEDLTSGSNKKVVLICDYCGAETVKPNKLIKSQNLIVNKDCCFKCRHKKSNDVCLSKYGVSNIFQAPETIEKIKSTNIEKYGVDNYSKTAEFKEKCKDTSLKNYGVEHGAQSPETQRKRKSTIKEKYGVEFISQSPEIKEKVKATNLERYGAEQFLSSEEGRKKSKQGMLDKHGVENAFNMPGFKDKSIETSLNKYGATHHLRNPENARIHADKVLQSKISSGKVTLHNGITIRELREGTEYSNSYFRKMIHEFGYDFAISKQKSESSIEVVMAGILDSMGLKYEKQYNLPGTKFSADFYLPQYSLVIECDGNYWHSDAICKDDQYHAKKRKLYIENNIRPLFFRENEILQLPDIVESIIRNKCGLSRRIFARKTEVKEVPKSIANQFVKENHLMGPGQSKISYGLYDNGELVSIIQFKSRADTYEISRYCSLSGVSVIGGFTKLIKHSGFTKISTFIDLRYGSGEYLLDLGFKKISEYTSFMWTNRTDVFHRLKFPSNTGYENGLYKLWDCGQAKYTNY